MPAGLRGRRAKRGGRWVRPRERARLPLSLALSSLSRGEGIGQCPGVATSGFHGRVKLFGVLGVADMAHIKLDLEDGEAAMRPITENGSAAPIGRRSRSRESVRRSQVLPLQRAVRHSVSPGGHHETT